MSSDVHSENPVRPDICTNYDLLPNQEDGGDQEGVTDDADAEEEGRAMRGMRGPRNPTQQEKEDHALCHIPIRIGVGIV